MWTYKGILVHRASANSTGIRWYARLRVDGAPPVLRADTKQGMRQLITHYLAA